MGRGLFGDCLICTNGSLNSALVCSTTVCAKKIGTFFSYCIFYAHSSHGGTSWVDVGDCMVQVSGMNRIRNGIQVCYLFIGILTLFGFVGDIKNKFKSSFDIAFSIFDWCAGVFNGHDHAILRTGDSLFSNYSVFTHGSTSCTFLGLTMGGFKEFVTFFTYDFIRGHTSHSSARRIHKGYIEFSINGHDGSRDGVEVTYFFI